MRLPGQDDHVAPVRLTQDTYRGFPDVLEHLDRDIGRLAASAKVGQEAHHATMRVGQPGLVTRLLVGAGPEGHRLRPLDGGGVDHTKAEQPGIVPSGPIDRESRRDLATSRAIERNEH